jgi:hypothetical protein
VRSALTHWVKAIEGNKFHVHNDLLK